MSRKITSIYKYTPDEIFKYLEDEYSPSELVRRINIEIEELLDILEHHVMELREEFETEMEGSEYP